MQSDITHDDEAVQKISEQILEKQSENAKLILGIGDSTSMATQQNEMKALRGAESAVCRGWARSKVHSLLR